MCNILKYIIYTLYLKYSKLRVDHVYYKVIYGHNSVIKITMQKKKKIPLGNWNPSSSYNQ